MRKLYKASTQERKPGGPRAVALSDKGKKSHIPREALRGRSNKNDQKRKTTVEMKGAAGALGGGGTRGAVGNMCTQLHGAGMAMTTTRTSDS